MFEKGKKKENYGEVGDIRVILSRERHRSLMMFDGVLLGFNGFFLVCSTMKWPKKNMAIFRGDIPGQ